MKKILFLFATCAISIATTWAQKYKVTIQTADGDIKIDLYDKTPQHRDNFVKLAKKGFYDSLLFHRVIPEFMIQGGDPDSKYAESGKMLGSGDVGYRIPAEFVEEYIHEYGSLAAARDNNPNKSSSGCQFYIVVGKKFSADDLNKVAQRTGKKYTDEQKKIYETVGGTPHLDNNYTIFGKVTSGMDVVQKIISQKRNSADRPDVDQRMLKVKVKKKFLFFYI